MNTNGLDVRCRELFERPKYEETATKEKWWG
jgi:hypothetical protein